MLTDRDKREVSSVIESVVHASVYTVAYIFITENKLPIGGIIMLYFLADMTRKAAYAFARLVYDRLTSSTKIDRRS